MRHLYIPITYKEVIPIKTRADIYAREATELLRLISIYPGLCSQQLYCFFPGKEDKIKTLLSHLTKQGRIIPTEHNQYFSAGFQANKIDNSLLRSVWILIDFIECVEYHCSSCEFPVKIIFLANEELYEIIHTPLGQETLINHMMQTKSSDGSHRIILVDAPEQIHQLNFPDISGFCTINEAGAVSYYKKTGGM